MRVFYFDLLRCIAIVLLLVAHIAQEVNSPLGSFFGIQGFYWVSTGGIAVTIFLILSGAVLELNYGKSNISYSKFIFKRILRIYPVYYLSLIFGMCVFSLRSWHQTGYFFKHFEKLDYSDLILSITAGYAYAGQWGGPFVETSWFIILIMTMYLFFPYLSKKIKEKPISFFILFLLISSISRLILGNFDILPRRPLDWFPLCRLFEFSLGIYMVRSFNIKISSVKTPSNSIKNFISFFSILSFPLFLFHIPPEFLINFLPQYGLDRALSIIFYLAVSIILSWMALKMDDKIPRKIINNKFDQIISNQSCRMH